MIGLAMALGTRLGVPEAFRRVFGWFVLVALAIALLGGLWALWAWSRASHDAGVRAADRAATSAIVVNRQIAADRSAGAAMDRRDDAFANDQQQLEERIDNATANDSSPLDALFDELRR